VSAVLIDPLLIVGGSAPPAAAAAAEHDTPFGQVAIFRCIGRVHGGVRKVALVLALRVRRERRHAAVRGLDDQ
jgi:hypothetical protein